MAMAMPFHLPLLFSLLFVFHSHAYALPESEALLKFKSALHNANALQSWDNNPNPPCNGQTANWVGVLCNKGAVWGLKLENMGLFGTIDVDSLKTLPNFTTISLMNNNFNGPIPQLNKLPDLRSAYLSNNKFSGEIPPNAFDGLIQMKKLHLSQNQLTGAIPASLATLPKLTELKLDRNRFSGNIPDFKNHLQTLDLSSNQLEGPIPASLSKIDKKMFEGNKAVCGGPLNACESTPAASNDRSRSSSSSSSGSSSSSKKTPTWLIVILVVVGLLIVVGILAVIMMKRPREQETSSSSSSSVEAPTANMRAKGYNKEEEQGSAGNSRNGKKAQEATVKLTFVRDDRVKFDLPDLLKASAEVLGSGSFGSSFKAALSVGPVVVVKRYKQMNNAGKEEFLEHMRRIGRLTHGNLLPLVAYYYRKEEKLLVSDFVKNGSLAVHLHGHKSLGQPALDWPTRLKIVKGVAKGLAYLHKELPSLIVPHGHLKSSNILLNDSFEPLLTDYGLIPIINQESAKKLLVAYKSPEYVQQGKISRKSDIWALGILILEILTGVFPANLKGKESDEQEDMANWVKTVVGDQETKVFDKKMGTIKDSDGELMQELLKIGLSCCEEDVEKRLDFKDAVGRIEELKHKDGA
ncbi:pollen receptor like kinase 1 [Hibiscus trionum]|uniref:non-specific serine/threonine protein kinase n=1 Tax=Hibiscus trionum TaxID=183268 RepID=A0A9W7LXW4_HIBTR|nr:pollen receptor like kinase 1 [Hibiscus trionum]